MTVRICFSAGSLAGQTFELAAGSSLSLGRSRTCDIKASEPDVSGRHLVFRRGAGAGVTVEVASSRKTLFNGTSVSMSDSFPVKNGDTFRCGGFQNITVSVNTVCFYGILRILCDKDHLRPW